MLFYFVLFCFRAFDSGYPYRARVRLGSSVCLTALVLFVLRVLKLTGNDTVLSNTTPKPRTGTGLWYSWNQTTKKKKKHTTYIFSILFIILFQMDFYFEKHTKFSLLFLTRQVSCSLVVKPSTIFLKWLLWPLNWNLQDSKVSERINMFGNSDRRKEETEKSLPLLKKIRRELQLHAGRSVKIPFFLLHSPWWWGSPQRAPPAAWGWNSNTCAQI